MMPVRRLKAAVAIVATMGLSIINCAASYADESDITAIANRFLAAPQCSLGGLSIGIVDHGQSSLMSVGLVHTNGGQPRAARPDDQFEIGSITKTFTATLYALALSEGKVSADAPAQDYMPEGVVLPTYQSDSGKTIPITLDSLARHASGLPRSVRGSPNGLSREEMAEELRSTRLLYAPGSGFLYSNLGFALLALAMERVYNGKIESLVPQMVAAPLGMSKTGFDADALGRDSVLEAYRPNGQVAPETNPNWPAFDGAAALRSTPADMQRYLLFNMRLASSDPLSPLLPTLQKEKRFRARGGNDEGGTKDIGLAWQNTNLPDGRHVIWKDGNVPGFRTFIGFTTTTPQIGVVVLASQNGCKSTKLGRCILEAISQSKPDSYCANPEGGSEENNGEP
jgi:D-alanyl-D-alanine-carboxypeptidase/D-alanyl-D-alanine-endopeptidase